MGGCPAWGGFRTRPGAGSCKVLWSASDRGWAFGHSALGQGLLGVHNQVLPAPSPAVGQGPSSKEGGGCRGLGESGTRAQSRGGLRRPGYLPPLGVWRTDSWEGKVGIKWVRTGTGQSPQARGRAQQDRLAPMSTLVLFDRGDKGPVVAGPFTAELNTRLARDSALREEPVAGLAVALCRGQEPQKWCSPTSLSSSRKNLPCGPPVSG